MTQMFRKQAETHYALSGTSAAFEIGCGRGGNLLVLSEIYEQVVGLDPHLTSLILAKKFLDEHGVTNVALIHGYGQQIPYAEGDFDYVTAVNVLEHVLDVERVVAEIWRILRPGGIFVADSRNRFDILFPEPHVRLRFVGLLPRRWAKRYVRWRRGLDYSGTQLLSYIDLSRVLKKHFRSQHKILCAKVSAYGYPATIDTWVDRLNRLPGIAQLMRFVFPSYLVVAQK
jgi:ubiquinone/menaquinone biosynthesis C-methylase UbiE